MSLYYIAVNNDHAEVDAEYIFIQIKVDTYGAESAPYIAFISKDLGAKYLEARNMGTNYVLVTLEEVRKNGLVPDMNNGTVVFETEEQISNSFKKDAGEYLRKLVH